MLPRTKVAALDAQRLLKFVHPDESRCFLAELCRFKI